MPDPPLAVAGWAIGFVGGVILGAKRTGSNLRRFPVAVVIGVLLAAPVSLVLTRWVTLPLEFVFGEGRFVMVKGAVLSRP